MAVGTHMKIIMESPPCVPFAKGRKHPLELAPESMNRYEILRTIALRGDLEAFVAISALDHELDEQTFDKTVEIEGVAWLKRGGAL